MRFISDSVDSVTYRLVLHGFIWLLLWAQLSFAQEVAEKDSSIDAIRAHFPAITQRQFQRLDLPLREKLAQGTLPELIVLMKPPAVASLPSDVPESARRARILESRDIRSAEIADRRTKLLDGLSQRQNSLSVRKTFKHLPMLNVDAASWEDIAALLSNAWVQGLSTIKQYKHAVVQSLPVIGANYAVGSNYSGNGTVIAVFDTGAEYLYPEMGSCTSPGVPASCKILHAQDFATEDGQRDVSPRHGTAVTATAAALAPGAKFVALDVFDGNSAGDDDIAAAVDWVLDNLGSYNFVAANFSLSDGLVYIGTCDGGPGPFASPFKAMFDSLQNVDILPVVASGNDAYKTGIGSPACVSSGFAVGATYDQGTPSNRTFPACQDTPSDIAVDKIPCFSNSGSELDLLAPGSRITLLNLHWDGTSMAAPHVAAAVALIKEKWPADSITSVKSRLTSSPVLITDPDNALVFPRLDIGSALDLTGTDSDGDGVVDGDDIAPNDPCIPSNVVAACDTDGDGVVDGNDPAPADPCNPSTFVAACDFDTDGDSKWDREEGSTSDADGDGILDYQDSATADTDADTVVDENDPANTDPCIPSDLAAACDTDGDGIADGNDPAPTDACVPSTFAATCDFDTDGDGKWDRDEGETNDSDGDGIADYQESSILDQDGDGAVDENDLDNADPCVPSSFVSNCDYDTDNDGKWDRDEGELPDADTDGIPDYQDSATSDADGDGVFDEQDENNLDPCVPSTFASTCDFDTDGDGKWDREETIGADSDSDGIPDYQESAINDADADGVSDEQDAANFDPCVPSNAAAPCDADGDGIVNGSDPAPSDPCNPSTFVAVCDFDTDGDGKWDRDEGQATDTDGDGSPDYLESSLADSDGDGTNDELDSGNNDPCIPDIESTACDIPSESVPFNFLAMVIMAMALLSAGITASRRRF